jgi:hypothetical protein
LELIGCVASITTAVANIDAGRKGFAVRGKADDGRIAYELGIDRAMSAFQEVQASADPQAIILAEYTFLVQELSFCHKSDTDSFSSLNNAIANFDEAFHSLKAVEQPCYKIAEKIYPYTYDGKYRINGFPKDSFHLACESHKTRLRNFLRTPGIDYIEKDLLKQRLTNLPVAQKSYIELQKKVLES